MPALAENRADTTPPPAGRAPPSGGVAITARGLAKTFGDNRVIRSLDLHVPAGQFVAIVGRSGCGKSTLLRLLLSLERATAGEIQAGPREAARLMFQEPRLLPWARVGANVAVGLDRSHPGAAREAHTREALREVGLADRAGDWPAVLSGGQKQRVALARALVGRPRLMALDEPLGALDALTRIEMQGLIERAWRAQGFTALLVTHDVSEAVALADRVLVVENGGISLDLPVTLPRPRRRGDPAMAALEGRILDRLFNDHGTGI